jgi:hypothetical protein
MARQRLAIVLIVVGTLLAGYAIGGGIDNIIRAVQGEDFTVSLAGSFLGLGVGAAVGWLLPTQTSCQACSPPVAATTEP